jgi:hypothetical protein
MPGAVPRSSVAGRGSEEFPQAARGRLGEMLAQQGSRLRGAIGVGQGGGHGAEERSVLTTHPHLDPLQATAAQSPTMLRKGGPGQRFALRWHVLALEEISGKIVSANTQTVAKLGPRRRSLPVPVFLRDLHPPSTERGECRLRRTIKDL